MRARGGVRSVKQGGSQQGDGSHLRRLNRCSGDGGGGGRGVGEQAGEPVGYLLLPREHRLARPRPAWLRETRASDGAGGGRSERSGGGVCGAWLMAHAKRVEFGRVLRNRIAPPRGARHLTRRRGRIRQRLSTPRGVLGDFSPFLFSGRLRFRNSTFKGHCYCRCLAGLVIPST
jgi:hypothetical protein